MFQLQSIRLLPVLALLASSSAYPAIILTATMTTDQEPTLVGPTTSSGAPRPTPFGTATFVLNDALTEMSFTATIFNIDVNGMQTPTDTNDNLMAAHIHAGTTATPTWPVVWGFFGTPANNNNPADGGLVAFTGGLVGGVFTGTWNLNEGNNTNLTAQIPNILAGRAYINFHTVQNGGGEIRGTIVPEPSTALLAIPALLGFAAYRRRRRLV